MTITQKKISCMPVIVCSTKEEKGRVVYMPSGLVIARGRWVGGYQLGVHLHKKKGSMDVGSQNN